jgi:CRP-like cAMP-binding protein
MNRATELFAGFPLLDGLADGHLEHIEAAARPATFAAGERIVEMDHPATACWLLERGRVAVDTPGAAGAPVVIQTLGPGDLLGWSWLVPPHRWHFGAVAVEPVMAIELDAATLRALADAHPDFGYALAVRVLRVMVDRLHATRARLLDLYGSPR